MPEITSCPQCQRKLRVPDELLGKKVKCPGCGLAFTATPDEPAAPPRASAPEEKIRREPAPRRAAVQAQPPIDEDFQEEEEQEEQQEERPRRGGGARQAWLGVRMGITLVLLSMLGMVIFVGVYFVGSVMAAQNAANRFGPGGNFGAAQSSDSTSTLLSICLAVLFFGSAVCRNIGYVFYLKAPERSGARLLAMICLGTGVAGVVLLLIILVLIFAFFATMLNGLGGGGFFAGAYTLGMMGWLLMILFVISLLLSGTEFFSSLFYHKAVAEHLRSHGVAASITYEVVVAAIAVLLYLTLIGILVATISAAVSAPGSFGPGSANAMNGLGVLMLACSCVSGILNLGSAVWYIVTHFIMLSVVNGAISRRDRDRDR